MQKKVLILYASYGTGHFMAANAIKEYFYKYYPKYNVTLFDPMQYSNPKLNSFFSKCGQLFATKLRNIRGIFFNKIMYRNFLKNSKIYNYFLNLYWNKELENKIKEFKPDIVISTQAAPTNLFANYKHLFKFKLIFVFTDYGIHRMYTINHNKIDMFCVPSEEIKNEMIELGIDKNKIVDTGIPVRFNYINNSIEIRKNIINKYKLNPDNPTLLFICGGGLGYDNAFIYFKKLIESSYDFNYIFISGKNEILFYKAIKLVEKSNKKGKVLGYVENIYELILSSDLVIGKPGGILTSETLNLEVPLCAIAPIPGQEVKNAKYISNNNFGFYIKNIKDFDLFLYKLSIKEIDLNLYKKNIKDSFKKFSFIDFD